MVIEKPNHKTDDMPVKNIYKENAENNKIQEILLKSYIIFIRREMEKCLQF